MLREFARAIFLKPEEIRQEKEVIKAKRLGSANRLEELATIAYLEGKISIDDYQLMGELTSPITKLDLVKLADEIAKRKH